MATGKSYYPLSEAESLLGLKPGHLLSLGAQGSLPIYVLADNWFANVWATPVDEIHTDNGAPCEGSEQIAGEPKLISPPQKPTNLNGPVRLTPESISWFEIQSPVAINAFMLHEPEEGDYPLEDVCEYRLIDPAKPPLSKNVYIEKGQLFITQADFKKISAQVPPKDVKPVSETERQSLYKLIIGMAIKGYKFDPKQSKSSVITDIQNDLEKLGISLSDDTIRKWLKEAASELPASKPNKS